ncbi:small subunit ribosomal protein S6 [Desulfohalotomaculum tongense]|uniref:30S ribosomal protein S6 n=1 Tax=Desulforadius tongensis TaxID=1216062 RepID=UPI001959947A|nr:30S ribosomal protein S6 [Desulforadius tongensis]MBM7855801.1 small subunit ribosomal protein S6 [Desulforadius tongensis]
MRNYELTFIVRADLEEEAIDAVIDKFTGLIKNNGGEVTEVEKWGKRRLAYSIQKQNDGFYVIVNFKAEPAVSHELERVLKITDEVLRHVVIRKEE